MASDISPEDALLLRRAWRPGMGLPGFSSAVLPLAAPPTAYGEKGRRSEGVEDAGVASAQDQLTKAQSAVETVRKRMAETSKALSDNSTEAAKLPGLRSQLQEQQLTLEALGRVRDEAAVASVGVPKLKMPDAPQFHPGAYPGQPGVVQPQLGLPNLIAGILGLVHPHSAGAFAGAAMQGQEQAAQAENERRQNQFREMFQSQVRANQDDMERADLKYRADVAKAQAQNKYDVDTAAQQRAAALASSKTKTAQDWQKAFAEAQEKILPAEQASVLVSGEAGELKQDAAELSAAERGETAARSQVGLAERKAADIQQKERERKSREATAAANREERWKGEMARLSSQKQLFGLRAGLSEDLLAGRIRGDEYIARLRDTLSRDRQSDPLEVGLKINRLVATDPGVKRAKGDYDAAVRLRNSLVARASAAAGNKKQLDDLSRRIVTAERGIQEQSDAVDVAVSKAKGRVSGGGSSMRERHWNAAKGAFE